MDPTRTKLRVMMFLQYFVWGAWFVTLGTYLGANIGEGKPFSEGFIGYAYSTAAIGAIISPFFVGMVADRFFASQHMLAVLHLVGAGILWSLTGIQEQWVFYGVMIAYFLCYMPTLALTNSLSFHHLDDPGKEFPGIRVLGTIGWIIAGLAVGWWWPSITGNTIEDTTVPMKIAAAASVVLAVYCLVLPHTPPAGKGQKITVRDILGLDALQLMSRFSFAVFVIGSFLITIPLQFYYSYTNPFLNELGMENAAGKMTMGQMSEIFFMLLMPFFFVRLGVKWMLLIGTACWAARYFLFAYGSVGEFWYDPGTLMLYGGILLHGVCYDFFFVTGQIYVDNQADKSIRGAAQGFIAFVTLGVGAFLGTNLSGVVEKMVRGEGGIDWTTFWLIPGIGAAVVMVLFALSFHEPKTAPEEMLAEEEGFAAEQPETA